MSPRAEIRFLRWPLLRLAVVLMFGLALCGTAYVFMQKAATEATSAEQNAQKQIGETRRLKGEEQEVRSMIAEYQTIVARGITSPEQRLNWVELMRSIQRERKLLGLEYEIQPQLSLVSDSLSKGDAGYLFKSSPMRVQLPLLHEDDLLHFLQDMQAQAPAFIRLRSCKLTRNIASAAEGGQQPQLLADCQIDWVTLLSTQGVSQ
jgi:hypothetical protein